MSAEQARHYNWDEIEVEPMSSTIDRQFLSTEKMMLARVLLKRGAHVPTHQHPNEQIAYILSGALEFRLEGRTVVVREGEVLTIPANVPHEAIALEDTIDLDVFCPPRQDWLDGSDDYLRQESAARS